MRVGYTATNLPAGELVRAVPGGARVLYELDAGSSGADIAPVLQGVVVPFAMSEWMHKGGCTNLRFAASPNLPTGIVATLIEGWGECVVLLDHIARGEDIAPALDEMLGRWAEEEWIYVGNLDDLRAVG